MRKGTAGSCRKHPPVPQRSGGLGAPCSPHQLPVPPASASRPGGPGSVSEAGLLAALHGTGQGRGWWPGGRGETEPRAGSPSHSDLLILLLIHEGELLVGLPGQRGPGPVGAPGGRAALVQDARGAAGQGAAVPRGVAALAAG